jgi:non-specific serine/threonine protein kinase
MRARVLLALIVIAIGVGVVGWIVRYQPFGPGGPRGTPLPSDAAEAAGWEALSDAPFARLEMATAAQAGRIWLAGGLTQDGGVLDAMSVFDPSTEQWSEGPALPEAVHHAAMASDGERLLLVGGYLGSTGQPTAAVRVLEVADGAWSDGPALPEARAAGALAWDGARYVYAGGVGPGGVRAEVFVLEDGAWRQIGELARPREHLAAASDGEGRAWLLGGRQGGLDRNLGDVELIEGDRVTLIAQITPRGGVAAFHVAAIGACLTGGEAPSFALATVECVDATGRITALPSMRSARHGHGAAVVGGFAYVLLGGAVPGLHAFSSVERLVIGE